MRLTLRTAILRAALLSLLFGTAAPNALACGFDGLLGDSFGAIHPKSTTVAFAISDAVAVGLIERSATAPIVPGNAGYWRAVSRVEEFYQLVLRRSEKTPLTLPVAVVFINSTLWSRITPTARGLTLDVHTSGADPNETVIVTSEAVIASVLDSRMPMATALERGLIVVDGDHADTVHRLLADAMRVPAFVGAKPFHLFGPSRNGH